MVDRSPMVGLLWLLLLVGAAPAWAASLQVVDARDGSPLVDAVVEVNHPGPSRPDTENDIIQRDATFIPHVSLVPRESRVSFPNRDTTRHHVFSFSPAKTFELELYLQETPPPVSFDRAGVVVLGCNIHDHMRAFIVVSDAPTMAMTDADGHVSLADLPPGTHTLRIWHPHLEDTHLAWWEGTITAGEPYSVALELRATPPAPPEPSALQQRFRQALEYREQE
ncbi:carboxypeptidase regulatory-like domain-containing protein [Halomonas sp. MA07-2]|uniref:carboxypeptidase regulatory-like domain-containing protein n=1 Tax=unclassified Halomonas TaxID=2609666 RepID=UPI003EF07FC2